MRTKVFLKDRKGKFKMKIIGVAAVSSNEKEVKMHAGNGKYIDRQECIRNGYAARVDRGNVIRNREKKEPEL